MAEMREFKTRDGRTVRVPVRTKATPVAAETPAASSGEGGAAQGGGQGGGVAGPVLVGVGILAAGVAALLVVKRLRARAALPPAAAEFATDGGAAAQPEPDPDPGALTFEGGEGANDAA